MPDSVDTRCRTFRALKRYPKDGRPPHLPLQDREDILIYFLTAPTAVAFDAPLPGDYVDRPTGYDVSPLAVTKLRNAAVTKQGFVFTERGELLREAVDRWRYFRHFLNARAALHSDLAAIPLESTQGTVAVLTGQRNNNYFHWWIDVLARLWALRNIPFADLRLLAPSPKLDFQAESLHLLGLDIQEMTRPIQRFPSVLFTRGLTYGSSQDIAPQVSEFAQWCRGKLGLPTSPVNRKLFLSRRGSNGRAIVNEKEILAALGDEFEVVQLETLTVGEQAQLFAHAAIVVAPHGAGLTNLLFCTRSAAVVELMHDDISPPYNYRRLAYLLGHRYIAIGCPSEGPQGNPGRRNLRPAPRSVVDAVTRLLRPG